MVFQHAKGGRTRCIMKKGFLCNTNEFVSDGCFLLCTNGPYDGIINKSLVLTTGA